MTKPLASFAFTFGTMNVFADGSAISAKGNMRILNGQLEECYRGAWVPALDETYEGKTGLVGSYDHWQSDAWDERGDYVRKEAAKGTRFTIQGIAFRMTKGEPSEAVVKALAAVGIN